MFATTFCFDKTNVVRMSTTTRKRFVVVVVIVVVDVVVVEPQADAVAARMRSFQTQQLLQISVSYLTVVHFDLAPLI